MKTRIKLVLAIACLVTPAPARENDVLVDLGSQNSVTFSAFDDSFPLSVPHGSVSLETSDPECVPSPTTPCHYTLNRLHFRLGGIQVQVSDLGDYDVIDPFISIDGPIALVDSGAGMQIPIGTRVRSGARIEGPKMRDGVHLGSGSLLSPVVMHYSASANIFTVDGTFPVKARIGDDTFTGYAAGLMTAEVPLRNTAPTVALPADMSLVCADFVDLDPLVFDRQANEALYVWDTKWKSLERRYYNASPSVYVPGGRTELSLTVVDGFGGIGRESFTIDVTDPPPTFVDPPGTFYAPSCGPLSLPVPQAVSECGEVLVESDAPDVFYAGQTLVTWTARTRTGQKATITQWVVVELGDDATCCPPGANVIEGTSNDDTLYGTEGPDCILGYGAQDIIDGLGGNDVISGGEGDDVILGGLGADAIFAGSGQDQIRGDGGDDFLQGGGGDDRIYAGSGNDELWGGQGQDQLYCEDGSDIAYGMDGDDLLSGGAGDDFLDGGANNDRCEGGTGIDTAIECSAHFSIESFGEPAFPADPNFEVCSCRPNKCADCSSLVTQCDSDVDCSAIIECIWATSGCNLPHECSGTCEWGRAPTSIGLARQTASCMGGCL